MKGQHIKILFLLALLAALPLSCMARNHRIEVIPELERAPRYFSELAKWKRTAKIYAELDIRCFITVVYRSRALREAFVLDYTDAYDLNFDEQRNLYAEEVLASDANTEFIISIFAPEPSWADLALGGDLWQLRLITLEGEEVEPLLITELNIKDPMISYYYPYAEPWSRHFKVTVPRPSGNKRVTLSMRSVVAGQDFEW